MGHSGETTRGFDSGELREQLENALSNFLGERDPATVQQLFADVMASLNGATVCERLGLELEGDLDPGIDLGLDQARAAEDDSSMEELREPSAQVGRYSLHGELARGGMGVVLRVWDRELRRTLAMKVAGGDGSVGKPTKGRTADSSMLARFMQEAQVTAQLDHPGVVPIHELGLDGHGRAFFTMRLVKGRTFKQLFTEARSSGGRWNRARALDHFLRACEAVASAHSKGVVHRDLKPDNVMIGNFGEVYVMDWGLAKVMDRPDLRDLRLRDPELPSESLTRAHTESATNAPLVTMDGAVMGTPAYMPPEQARGDVHNIDARSDVYSLGAMLYELLSGAAPYVPTGGERLGMRQVLVAVLDGPPAKLERTTPDAPAELVAICERAMEREQADRYADVSELVEDLRAFQESRVVHAYESGPLAELRKWILRNRRFAASMAALLLVTLGGLAATSWVNARGRAEVLRMADAKRVRDYAAEAALLWPAWPERDGDLRDWLDKARALHANLASHEAALASLAAAARTSGDGDLAFDSEEDAWRHETLSGLVVQLRALGETEDGLLADVERRIDLAGSVQKESIDDHRLVWDAARRSIADEDECPAYGGLELQAQLGLVPLWRDEESGLWEFWVWNTGSAPVARNVVSPEDAVVMVLLPGGTFRMGAIDPEVNPSLETETNIDPLAEDNEGPPHDVALEPFFLSKYELTQEQWARLGGTARAFFHEDQFLELPGAYREALLSTTSPIESVSWEEADNVLWRMALGLPTEAQWEYAARAGSTTPLSWGGYSSIFENHVNSFILNTNVVSLWAVQNYPMFRPHYEAWAWGAREGYLDLPVELDEQANRGPTDRYIFTAPVGSFPANRFGLYDLEGNVMEWCRERSLPDYAAAPPVGGEGLRAGGVGKNRVVRGGAYNRSWDYARSAKRGSEFSDNELNYVGVRASRPLLD